MKKFIYFPLWRIEDIETYLENMEQKGYRLDQIKHSYYFYFKESNPKQMHYFLSCKSSRGKNMLFCDYALLSNHGAHPIESKMSFYTMYRTKEPRENLSLLYEGRLDYIKIQLLEKGLASLFLAIYFLILGLLAIITQSSYKTICFSSPIIGMCIYLTVYYFYGFLKQKNKCKNYEHDNFNSLSP